MILEKKKLSDYLKASRSMVNKKNNLSISNTFCIEVNTNVLSIKCFDAFRFFEASLIMEENVGAKNTFLLKPTIYDSLTIYEAVKSCKGKKIEVSLHDGYLYFNDILLPESTFDSDSFPINPFDYSLVTYSGSIEKMDTFKRAFRFISNDITRYFLNGVNFILDKNNVGFESTDGRTALLSKFNMGNTNCTEKANYIVRDITKFISLNMNEFKINEKAVHYYNDKYKLTISNIIGTFRMFPE